MNYKQVKRITKNRTWCDIVELEINNKIVYTYKDSNGSIGKDIFSTPELCEYYIKNRTNLLESIKAF
jgi:hypothetical protein